MKSIIICEGETDFVFLQHFMIRVNGWNDSKQMPNPSFRSNVNNSLSRDFFKDSNMLTIISCGGCGNIKTVFEEVIRRNENEIEDSERYSKIVILTDNDEDCVEEKIIFELNDILKNKVQISNNKWTTLTFEDTVHNQFDSELLLLIIPFDENGALESFLLESISKENTYDAEIIKKSKEFVDNADPEKKYLSHREFVTKARLYAYFAIRIEPTVNQFRQRQNVLTNVPWEKYENVRTVFKELKKL